MGLNMCIEQRQRQCKYLNLDNNFGNSVKKSEKPEDFIIGKTFQSCIIYRKQNNVVSTRKKIRKYEKGALFRSFG